MNSIDIDRVAAWVVEQGLSGTKEQDILAGFCDRCREVGIDINRGLAVIDTLHPIYEGRAFRWRGDGVAEDTVVDYGPTTSGAAEAEWQSTVFYHLLTNGGIELRRNIGNGDRTDFKFLEKIKGEGETDFLAFLHRFSGAGTIGEMDCCYSHWTSRSGEGFSEANVAALRRLVPSLALAIKCGTLARIASTLVGVYLGDDAGQRVLSGRISRGVTDKISAVLWFSDLRGYTTITDTAAPDEIIPFLNDYADAVISAVRNAGGDVLKLIGDGTLAIFKADDPADACRAALAAEAQLRQRLLTLNAAREVEGRPTTSIYLGLHIGEVFYGNIGSADRLDFTVVGPAVNEVSRIASMCRSVDRHVIMSSDFVASTPEAERQNLVSVGRFALRGVRRARELFTIDPALL
ncbi:adenylate cyclase [Rhodoligotrophos appendicifer]|uniref:adenylate/guanylate cyclase domain-containing protein n=1 Tax=Rhodoligotrophos appendicifer TaxID=987056 RepID=UPI00118478F6|nr:adenylate/guanylate cyclase domain-containing protein [Rhodoligotrophos appendicifer]